MSSISNLTMEDEAEGRTLNSRATGYIEAEGGADRTQEFYYLAGPMTGIAGNNFPAFHEAADTLREQGLNILNPAELGEEAERAAAEASKDGTDDGIVYGDLWRKCLRRDINIVSHPNCVGIICIDGWEASEGAHVETYIAVKFQKSITKFNPKTGKCIEIQNRREALERAGILDV